MVLVPNAKGQAMRGKLVWFVIASVLQCAGPARADEPWHFAQITCVPELGYFSIRRILIMNLPKKGPYLTEGLDPGRAAVEALQRNHGIFSGEEHAPAPAVCAVPPFSPIPGWGSGDRPGF